MSMYMKVIVLFHFAVISAISHICNFGFIFSILNGKHFRDKIYLYKIYRKINFALFPS